MEMNQYGKEIAIFANYYSLYSEVSAHLNDFVRGDLSDYVIEDKLYLFVSLQKPGGSSAVYKLLGELDARTVILLGYYEIYDCPTQHMEKQVFCFSEHPIDKHSLLFIDDQGALISIDEPIRNATVYKGLLSEKHDVDASKLSHKQIRQLQPEPSQDHEILYFSYVNWEATSSCFPTVSSSERALLKQCDGQAGNHESKCEETGNEMFSVVCCGKKRILPRFCFNRLDDPNLSEQQLCNDVELKNKIMLQYTYRFHAIPKDFVTTAYIRLGNKIHGFAIVSRFENATAGRNTEEPSYSKEVKHGLFQLESPIYQLSPDHFTYVDEQLLKRNGLYLPCGYLAGNREAEVYAMYYWDIEQFRHEYNKRYYKWDGDSHAPGGLYEQYISRLLDYPCTPQEIADFWEASVKYDLLITMGLYAFFLNYPEIVPMERIQHEDGVFHLDKYYFSLLPAVKNKKLKKIQEFKNKGYSKGEVARILGISLKEVGKFWGKSRQLKCIKDSDDNIVDARIIWE